MLFICNEYKVTLQMCFKTAERDHVVWSSLKDVDKTVVCENNVALI